MRDGGWDERINTATEVSISSWSTLQTGGRRERTKGQSLLRWERGEQVHPLRKPERGRKPETTLARAAALSGSTSRSMEKKGGQESRMSYRLGVEGR